MQQLVIFQYQSTIYNYLFQRKIKVLMVGLSVQQKTTMLIEIIFFTLFNYLSFLKKYIPYCLIGRIIRQRWDDFLLLIFLLNLVTL